MQKHNYLRTSNHTHRVWEKGKKSVRLAALKNNLENIKIYIIWHKGQETLPKLMK